MKQVVVDNAGDRAVLTFASGWAFACLCLAVSHIVPPGIPFFVYLLAVIAVSAGINMFVILSARRSASRAYELGEAQGAIDAWAKVTDEITRARWQKDA